MIGQEFICARPGCEETETKTTHNQKYCSAECCRLATNAKIMEKYHQRAAIRRGAKRVCAQCQETPLSRYNDSEVCGKCVAGGRVKRDNSISGLLANVSWA